MLIYIFITSHCFCLCMLQVYLRSTFRKFLVCNKLSTMVIILYIMSPEFTCLVTECFQPISSISCLPYPPVPGNYHFSCFFKHCRSHLHMRYYGICISLSLISRDEVFIGLIHAFTHGRISLSLNSMLCISCVHASKYM